MLLEIRDRTGDTLSVRWTDAQLRTKLHFAAQEMANQLASMNGIPFGRSSYSVVATGETRIIPLLAVTDYASPREMLDASTTQSPLGTRWVDPREMPRMMNEFVRGLDRDNNWIYTVNRKKDDTYRVTATGTFTLTFNAQTTSSLTNESTAAAVQAALEALSTITAGEVEVTLIGSGIFDVRFIGAKGGRALQYALTLGTGSATVQKYEYEVEFIGKPGRTFTHIYNTRVAELTDDNESYTDIPVEFHGRLISHAVMLCLGSIESSGARFAADYEGMQHKSEINAITNRPTPGKRV